MQLFNPFKDPDFAKFQLAFKASKLHELDGIKIYQLPLNKKYCIFYTYEYTDKIHALAKEENAVYTLIESYDPIQNPPKSKKSIKQIIPRHTLAIDLTQSEDEILSQMHQKGRYNIKIAEKHNIQIKEEKDIHSFYTILETTSQRDEFAINPKIHYESMLQILGQKNKAKLFMAYLDDKPIAGILNTYIENTATYFYGASSNEHRNTMAPYLLQWHAIKDAKSNGFELYDLLGIADPTKPNDPLSGVTQFKKKFTKNMITHPESKTIVHKSVLFKLLSFKNK